jgi:hypothetical protein
VEIRINTEYKVRLIVKSIIQKPKGIYSNNTTYTPFVVVSYLPGKVDFEFINIRVNCLISKPR